MSALDLLLGQQFKASDHDTSQAIQDILAGSADYQTHGEDLVAAITKGGQAATVIEAAKAKAEADNQFNNQKIASDFGMNAADATNIISSLALKEKTADAARSEALDTIKQKQSVGILDNPLSWMMNQLTINKDIDAYNNANREQQATSDRLMKLNNIVQETVKTNNEINTGNTAATVLARASVVESKAAVDAEATRMNMIKYNTDAIKTVTALGDNLFEKARSMKQLELQEQAMASQLEEQKLRGQEREDKVKAGKDIQAEMNNLALDVNRGMQILKPGAAEVTPMQAYQYLKMDNDPNSLWHRAQASGALSRVGVRVIGSAGDAAALLTQVNAPTDGVQGSRNKFLMEVQRDVLAGSTFDAKGAAVDATTKGGIVATTLKGAPVNVDDPKQLSEGVAQIAKLRLAAMANNIKANDGDNILQAPPIKSILGVRVTNVPGSPTVGDMPFVKDAIAPAIQSGTTNLKPQDIFDIATTYLKQRSDVIPSVTSIFDNTKTEAEAKLVDDTARGIVAMYRSAGALNTAHKDFLTAGLPAQNSYWTEIDGKKVNTMEITSVKEMLMNKVMKAAVGNYYSNGVK